jgi:hypothetical protein
MIPVEIEYKPFGLLPSRRITAMMPARWSELTPDQMVVIPDLMRDKISETKVLEEFLRIRKPISRALDSYQRLCVMQLLKFLKKPEAVGTFIIPVIKGFRGPGNNLKGVCFGAFMFGDTYYQRYVTGDKKSLDRFIACFYYGKKGFDEQKIEKHAAIIGKADLKLREAVAVNYGLIREWLSQVYPYVFMKQEEGKRKRKAPGWVKVFDRIVGEDIVHQDDYARSPATEILRHLNEEVKEYYKNGGKVQRPG